MVEHYLDIVSVRLVHLSAPRFTVNWNILLKNGDTEDTAKLNSCTLKSKQNRLTISTVITHEQTRSNYFPDNNKTLPDN